MTSDINNCNKRYLPLALSFMFLFAVGCTSSTDVRDEHRNTESEKMLEGVWLNKDDSSIAFRAENDTVYYPDSTSMPVHYRIIADTLYLDGSTVIKYPIVKQSEHVFKFENNAGDVISLVKTNDAELEDMFEYRTGPVCVLNQNKVVKKDTVVVYDENRYHSYIQVNPTTYKVIKTSYNNDGVMVENVYYDNIVHISIYKLTAQLFSKDFNKAYFKAHLPEEFYSQGILSDMIYEKCSSEGIHYTAVFYIPDTMTNFLIDVIVSFDGKVTVDVEDKNTDN